MSKKFPVIALTGSSGSGTSSITSVFEKIFKKENIKVQTLCGDAMHRYERAVMDAQLTKYCATGLYLSHFNPEANLLKELADTFQLFGEVGKCKVRKYIHTEEEAAEFNCAVGTMTPWEDSREGAEAILYEGLHGGYIGEEANVAQHVDLLIGVAPIINLEWIQKLHRDPKVRGYSKDKVTDIILKRMPDYVRYICPQFSRTHINFQRIPLVDSSNPFMVEDIPNLSDSLVVINAQQLQDINFPYLLSMISGAMMTKPNTMVIPGGKLELAIQLIFTPIISRLMQSRNLIN